MIVFQSLQKSMLVLGIKRPLPGQKNLFNWLNILPFISLVRYAIFAFPIAETFNEYAEILHAVLTSCCVATNLLIFILKMQNIFELIDDFQSTIQQRKFANIFSMNVLLYHFTTIFADQTNPTSKKMYDKANAKIEKYTKIFYFVGIKVSWPGLILPNVIISYFKYFTTDLGSESFKLPFVEW